MTTIVDSTPRPFATSDGVFDQPEFRLAAHDLYRNIHKGIRAELFAVTTAAGRLGPADRWGRLAVADHLHMLDGVLRSHAEHEDTFIDPALAGHLPQLAERIQTDHHSLDGGFATVLDISASLVDAGGASQRRLAHQLYLELGRFTSAYLAHQDLEERVVMPSLEQVLSVEAIIGIHMAIVGSIPPDEAARSLAFMLPAMNLDDRSEVLQGMQASAPPEAVAGVVSLARSVLEPADFAALAARTGVA